MNERTPITILYTNHRGETGVRRILPIRFFFGATPWHEQHQWLLEAFDAEKQEHRIFAMKDIRWWRYGDVPRGEYHLCCDWTGGHADTCPYLRKLRERAEWWERQQDPSSSEAAMHSDTGCGVQYDRVTRRQERI